MKTVSEQMYVEMQRNHIAHAESLKERIAELERELAYSKGTIDAVQEEMGWSKSDALARRDKLVAAWAFSDAASECAVQEWAEHFQRRADRLRREANGESQ